LQTLIRHAAPCSDWVAEQRAAMAVAEVAASAGGTIDEDDEEELVGPQLPETAPGDRGNWGGALRPGMYCVFRTSMVLQALLRCSHKDGSCSALLHSAGTVSSCC